MNNLSLPDFSDLLERHLGPCWVSNTYCTNASVEAGLKPIGSLLYPKCKQTSEPI